MQTTGLRGLGVVAAIAFLGISGSHAQVPVRRSPIDSVYSPGMGVADGAEPWAVTLNPASLGGLRGHTFGLRHSELTSQIPWSGRGTGAYFASPLPYLSAFKVGGGLEVLRPHDDLSILGKLTVAMAYQPVWWASVGLLYGHTFGKPGDRSYAGLDTVSFGLHLRGNRRLAFGAMFHDLNAPKPTDPAWLPQVSRSYELEALLQPLGDSRWDIGLGVRIGEATPELSPRLRLWVRPTAGLGIGIEGSSVIIPGSGDPVAYRIGFGLGIDFSRIGASVFQLAGYGSDAPLAYHGGSVAVRMSQERYPALWSGPRQVLRLHLGEVGDRALLKLLLALRDQKQSQQIEGVLVIVSGVSGSWATAYELRQALVELRKAGKRVIAYGADLGTREYYIASAADEILLDPVGLVRLSGIAQGTTHYREALLRLGIRADLVRIGRFKASPESFTRDGPTELTRLQRQSVVDDLSQRVLGEIAESRHLPLGDVERLVERGQQLPQLAKSARLVDAIASQEELQKRLVQLYGPSVRVANLPREPRSPSARPHGVAVIEVSGDLTDGQSFALPYVDFRTVGAQSLSAAIERAAQDPRIEAVVLRVDSPGGSALAADMLARQIKQLAQQKPVICSFGDLAASGGYYLSAPCREIFADPLTITGSIGIFGGKVDVSGLLAKFGVERARYTSGPHADMESPFRAYSDEERELLRERLQAGYDRFLDVVESGRKLSRKELEPLAEGRVFSGGQAAAGRLVDKLGGLADAVARARELAGLAGENDAAVIFLPDRPRSLLRELVDVAGGLTQESTQLLPGPLRELIRLVPPMLWALSFDGSDVLLRLDEEPVKP